MPPRLHAIEAPITPQMREEITRLRAEIARANRLLLTAWKRFEHVNEKDAASISLVAEQLQALYAEESKVETRIRSALAEATALSGTELDCLCAASLANLN